MEKGNICANIDTVTATVVYWSKMNINKFALFKYVFILGVVIAGTRKILFEIWIFINKYNFVLLIN